MSRRRILLYLVVLIILLSISLFLITKALAQIGDPNRNATTMLINNLDADITKK